MSESVPLEAVWQILRGLGCECDPAYSTRKCGACEARDDIIALPATDTAECERLRAALEASERAWALYRAHYEDLTASEFLAACDSQLITIRAALTARQEPTPQEKTE